MGLFTVDNTNNLKDYLDKTIDSAEIKAICGEGIQEIKFMKLAIYIVSTYIATAISTCDFKVSDGKNFVKDINYYKLNISPNPNDTGTRFKYNFTKKMITEGSSLVVAYNNYLYFADSFSIEDTSEKSLNGYKFTGVTIQDIMLNKIFPISDCFYFKLDKETAADILKLIDDKYQKILSNAIKSYEKTIDNKWKLKISSMKQNDPKFQEEYETYVTEQLKSFINTDEGIYPELDGYELSKFNSSDNKTDSTDIRELRKDIFEMVAEAFKLPPAMMYGNISNLKEVINQFITFAVKPYASLISEEITRTLFSEKEILKGKKVWVDISTINYRDIFDIASGLDKLISTGVANIDEARPLINLPTLNTEFSKQYWITKNYAKIEDMMKEQTSSGSTNNNVNDNDDKKGVDEDAEK